MSQDNSPGGICPKAGSERVTYVPTSRRDAAKARVRKWKRNRARWLAARAESFAGETFADLLEAGRARRYELGHHVEHELRRVLSARAVLLLGVVMACERGFGGNRGGVRLAHATAARILHCSERSAGSAMRELASVGLVEARWHFVTLTTDEGMAAARQAGQTGACKHRERTPAYVTTSRARDFCARREARFSRGNQVGKNYQPGRTHRSLRERVNGAPGRGRPEQAFVADVLRARQVETEPPRVAKVIEKLPDGREAHGSPLRFGVGRLANASVAVGRARQAAEDKLFEVDPVAWAASFCGEAWKILDEREQYGQPEIDSVVSALAVSLTSKGGARS